MEESVIRLEKVSKTFRDFWLRPTVAAVDSLDLEVRRGEVFGLLGPNGSGKSTTIKMILGLLSPSAGKVSLFGLPPHAKAARARLGYLPELSYLHPFLTARETLMYYAGLCSLPRAEARARADQLLEMVKLSDMANRAVGGCSKGMARRVALASALVGKPELRRADVGAGPCLDEGGEDARQGAREEGDDRPHHFASPCGLAGHLRPRHDTQPRQMRRGGQGLRTR